MSKKKSVEEFVEMLNKNDCNTVDIIGEFDGMNKKFACDNSINFLEIWYYDDTDYKLTEWFSLHNKQIP